MSECDISALSNGCARRLSLPLRGNLCRISVSNKDVRATPLSRKIIRIKLKRAQAVSFDVAAVLNEIANCFCTPIDTRMYNVAPNRMDLFRFYVVSAMRCHKAHSRIANYANLFHLEANNGDRQTLLRDSLAMATFTLSFDLCAVRSSSFGAMKWAEVDATQQYVRLWQGCFAFALFNWGRVKWWDYCEQCIYALKSWWFGSRTIKLEEAPWLLSILFWQTHKTCTKLRLPWILIKSVSVMLIYPIIVFHLICIFRSCRQ